MRRVMPALCLVGVLWASTATAGPIGIDITSGGTNKGLTELGGAALSLFGDDFVLTAKLDIGLFTAHSPYLVGAQMAVHAFYSGLDAQGSLTYQGQTLRFGGFNDPNDLFVNFDSDPFIVPTFDNPVVQAPFSLNGRISLPGGPGDLYTLHGTGTMTFTFSLPNPNIRPENQPGWFGGAALFTIEPSPIEQTPEPSVFISLGAALSGLIAYTRRRAG